MHWESTIFAMLWWLQMNPYSIATLLAVNSTLSRDAVNRTFDILITINKIYQFEGQYGKLEHDGFQFYNSQKNYYLMNTWPLVSKLLLILDATFALSFISSNRILNWINRSTISFRLSVFSIVSRIAFLHASKMKLRMRILRNSVQDFVNTATSSALFSQYCIFYRSTSLPDLLLLYLISNTVQG